ncbi:MAG: hypothetical protein ACOZCO_13360 [Bacteroidota bacterium]
MKIKLFFLFAFLFALTLRPMAQPGDDALKNATLDQKFDAAIQLMELKQYYQASLIWKNILSEFPDNTNYNYQAGICLLNANINKKQALPYLEKGIGKISKNYNPYDPYEDRTPVDIYFYLGQAYHLNGKFDKAIEMFNTYKAEAGKKHFLQEKVGTQIAWANNAKFETENPRQKNSTIYNIGATINSSAADYSPVLSLDERLLFFTSRRLRADSSNLKPIAYIVPQDGQFYEDIYYTINNRENNEWSEPKLASLSELRENEATISLSADGLQLFVYHDDGDNGNIYFSDFADTAFGDLQDLGSDINTDSWETHVTLTADGNTLYFVSDRPGGLGGRDIYRCVKLPNGQWSKALNVGAPINTPQDEDAPFISAGGKYLYFSSNSDKSMGGFDVFVSEFKEDGTFNEPTPIGVPINSTDDDVFFITNASGKRGYFSSFREDGLGDKDIYVIEMNDTLIESIAILKGYIIPPRGQNLPDNLMIYATDLTEESEPEEFRPRPLDGSYVFALKPCHEYLIDYQIDGTTFHQYQFQVPCEAGYNELEKILNLDDIKLGPDTPDVEPEYIWHVQVKGLPANKGNLTADYLDEKGNVIYSEPIDESGNFTYRPLKKDQSYIFQIKADGKPLCDELEVVLLNNEKNVIGKTIRDERCKLIYHKDKDTIKPETLLTANPVDYEKYYKYNKKGITSDDRNYKKLVDGIAKLVKANGVAYIEIESSASKVPTTTFKTNENLAKLRLDDAKNKLMANLKAKGVDVSKVKISSETSLVLGPEYNDDWKENQATYEKYQYIRIKAR